MKNKHLKITVDILMVLFAVLSFSEWEGKEIFHYVVGSICYLLFAVHVYLNRQWMAAVKKAWKTGKLTKPVKRQLEFNNRLADFFRCRDYRNDDTYGENRGINTHIQRDTCDFFRDWVDINSCPCFSTSKADSFILQTNSISIQIAESI